MSQSPVRGTSKRREQDPLGDRPPQQWIEYQLGVDEDGDPTVNGVRQTRELVLGLLVSLPHAKARIYVPAEATVNEDLLVFDLEVPLPDLIGVDDEVHDADTILAGLNDVHHYSPATGDGKVTGLGYFDANAQCTVAMTDAEYKALGINPNDIGTIVNAGGDYYPVLWSGKLAFSWSEVACCWERDSVFDR